MFRPLAQAINAQTLVSLHPAELTGLLELAWNLRQHPAVGVTIPLGDPGHRSDVPGMQLPDPRPVLNPPSPTGAVPGPAAPFAAVLNRMVTPPGVGVRWDHLIYAYMIENTRIYEIFRRVVHEFVHGEKLGVPTNPDTQLWLRNTEELFYRDPPPFLITTLSSDIRPDLRASRRNAYWRMFGMPLGHGTDDDKPYTFVRADGANNEFVTTFEDLLREAWVGFVNRTTTTANPTDDAKIEELAHKLHDMLRTRRQTGNLSREEFFFVSMMSWFHLTVESNLPIITDLRATGEGPEQRLFKIASTAGLPAHGLSRSFFEIADVISRVLTAIETGTLHVAGAARAFYDPIAPGPINLANDMNTINTHWSIITGHDVKAGKVAIR
jgi:hypothetical protein